MGSHPQFSVLDSIRFVTTFIPPTAQDGESNDRFTIGINRVKSPISFKEGLFIPPGFTRDIAAKTRIGISLGSCLSGMNLNVHGSIDKDTRDLIRSYSPKVILDLTSARKEIDQEMFDLADCIWLDISGSEPHTGNEKHIRKNMIPPEIDKKKDLIHLVSMLKELKEIPLIVSIKGTDVKNDMDNVLVTEADGIHISCGYDLTGKSGPAYYGLTSEPVSTAIEAIKHMDVFRSREKGVKLLLSGPVRNGADHLKLSAIGADLIGPEIIMTDMLHGFEKDPSLMEWDVVGEGLDTLLNQLREDISINLGNLNKRSINDLSRSDLQVDNYHAAAVTGLPVMGYGREIPFWRH